MIPARRHKHKETAFIPAPRRIRTCDSSVRAVEDSTQHVWYPATAVIGGGFVGALNSVSRYPNLSFLEAYEALIHRHVHKNKLLDGWRYDI
jgi:hypothetical protein